jgi:hypothetical protein
MIGFMVSDIILSKHVFGFLSITGLTDFARTLHMTMAYWCFVLLPLHVGLTSEYGYWDDEK